MNNSAKNVEYRVRYNLHGESTPRVRNVTIIDGYSTTRDIPKILAICHEVTPDAIVVADIIKIGS